MSTFGFGLHVDNVNDALPLGIKLLQEHGVERESRGIKVIKVPGPVSTIYETPERRVLFDEKRDANPFFHLMESLWILGGSNKVDVPAHYLDSLRQFSDNGATFHGAYGYRLRHYDASALVPDHAPGIDQLTKTIDLLREKRDTRQAVISIWNPVEDLGRISKDIPCNDMLMFNIEDDRLDMQVCNRSNDAIWGAYGANAVQFSMIQELIATAVGVGVGRLVQHSWNFHAYPSNPYWQAVNSPNHIPFEHNHYTRPGMHSYALATTPAGALVVLKDCEMLCDLVENRLEVYLDANRRRKHWQSQYFKVVVDPIISAYRLYKAGAYESAIHHLQHHCRAPDWSLACQLWVARRGIKAGAFEA